MTQDNNDDGLIWEQEAENLSDSGDSADYFKPPQGETDIKFLNNGNVYTDQKKFDDEEYEYVTFKIEADGEEFKWDMKKSSAKDSKFGKIARYAAAKGGLEGETMTWFRQGEGTDTSHVLMDLADLEGSDSETGEEDSDSPGDESEEKETIL